MASDREQRRSLTPGAGVPASDPDTIRAIARRTHDTQKTADSTLTQVGHTLDTVSALRVELNGRIDVIDARVDELSKQTANMDGKLDILVEVSRERRQLNIAAVEAHIEVEKTGQLAAIGERKAKAEYWRTLGLKVTTGIGAVWALVSAMILAGRC